LLGNAVKITLNEDALFDRFTNLSKRTDQNWLFDLRQVKVNLFGTGSEQYPPRMFLGLLLYSYATNTFGGAAASNRTSTMASPCACSPPTS
jgi:hypothetical protein